MSLLNARITWGPMVHELREDVSATLQSRISNRPWNRGLSRGCSFREALCKVG